MRQCALFRCPAATEEEKHAKSRYRFFFFCFDGEIECRHKTEGRRGGEGGGAGGEEGEAR